MDRVQILFEMQNLPKHGHRDDERGDSTEDGTGHEVGTENSRMPHRDGRHREVERHNRVHRHRDRHNRDRHDLHRRFQPMPLLRGSLPAERKHPVDPLPQAGRAIAHEREVRDHREKQEQGAARQVRRDREEVPHQWRAEVRPYSPLAGIRHEVEGKPRPAEVNDGEQCADHQREDRDDLGASRHRPAPGCIHKSQDRRNQSSRVADADPENKVRDVEGPVDRPLDTRHHEPVRHLVHPRPQAGHDNSAKHQNDHVEPRRSMEDRAQQVVVDLVFLFQVHLK